MKKLLYLILVLFVAITAYSLFFSKPVKYRAIGGFGSGEIIPENLKLKTTSDKIISTETTDETTCLEWKLSKGTSTCAVATTTQIVKYDYVGTTTKPAETYKGYKEDLSKRKSNLQVFSNGDNGVMKLYFNDLFGGTDYAYKLEFATTTKDAFDKQNITPISRKILDFVSGVANASTATTSLSKATYLFGSNPTTAYNDGQPRYVGAITGQLNSPLSFTLPAGSGTISKITLFLYVAERGGSAFTVNLHQNLHSDWSQAQATYNAYKTGSNWTTAGGGSGTDYNATVVEATSTPALGVWSYFDMQGGAADNPLSLTWGNSWDGWLRSTGITGTRYIGYKSGTDCAAANQCGYIEITYTASAGSAPTANIINFE